MWQLLVGALEGTSCRSTGHSTVLEPVEGTGVSFITRPLLEMSPGRAGSRLSPALCDRSDVRSPVGWHCWCHPDGSVCSVPAVTELSALGTLRNNGIVLCW